MLFSSQELTLKIDEQKQRIRWIKLSLLVVGLVALWSFAAVVRGLVSGWGERHYYHAFIALAWSGFLVVQYKILRKRERWAARLEADLRSAEDGDRR